MRSAATMSIFAASRNIFISDAMLAADSPGRANFPRNFYNTDPEPNQPNTEGTVISANRSTRSWLSVFTSIQMTETGSMKLYANCR